MRATIESWAWTIGSRALGLALAVVVALAGPPGVGRAAEGVPPDLAVTYVGVDPDNRGEMLFRVANVGKWWVAETVATVESTVGSKQPTQTIRIPDLGPVGDPETASQFEFTYPMVCSQGGYRVKVTLKAARDWAGDDEINLANNVIEPWGCEPYQGRPQPPPAPVPEWKQPGIHTRELSPPSVSRMHGLRRQNDGALGCLPDGGLKLVGNADVGYHFIDGFGCDVNYVWQLVLNFDLEWLRGIENKKILRAELRFDEEVHGATDNDGNRIAAATCIGRLGLAPANWPEIVARTGDQASLLASKPVVSDRMVSRSGATIGWYVLDEVDSAGRGTNPPLAGFVMHGPDENLNAESERSCGSSIHNARLQIEYEVLP
jgi:hypothetical protein